MLEECSLIIVLIHIKWYSVTEWSRHKVQKKSFLFFFFFWKRWDSSGNSMPLEEGKTMNQGRPRGMTSDVTTTGDEEKSTWQLEQSHALWMCKKYDSKDGTEL